MFTLVSQSVSRPNAENFTGFHPPLDSRVLEADLLNISLMSIFSKPTLISIEFVHVVAHKYF